MWRCLACASTILWIVFSHLFCSLIFTAGYFLKTSFIKEVKASCRAAAQVQGRPAKTSFFDSNTGKPLFVAPGRGRSMDDFLIESRNHGWLSFRDDEVVWANVRILRNGEVVSVDGTHLGHNLPDANGPRHCINLVSVAGRPHPEAGHL